MGWPGRVRLKPHGCSRHAAPKTLCCSSRLSHELGPLLQTVLMHFMKCIPLWHQLHARQRSKRARPFQSALRSRKKRKCVAAIVWEVGQALPSSLGHQRKRIVRACAWRGEAELEAWRHRWCLLSRKVGRVRFASAYATAPLSINLFWGVGDIVRTNSGQGDTSKGNYGMCLMDTWYTLAATNHEHLMNTSSLWRQLCLVV